MKSHHVLGVLALAAVGGYWVYYRKTAVKEPVVQNALSGNLKGYSSLMKLSPKYYNMTSTEGAGNPQEVEDNSNLAMASSPWTLGHNGGDAMEISAGWTDWPDTYASQVAQAWKRQAVAGSHL